MYLNGEGITKNIEEAFEWNLKAANNGDAGAEYYIGVCYQEKNDVKQAFNWFLKAANQGTKEAQYNVAVYYFKDNGNDLTR